MRSSHTTTLPGVDVVVETLLLGVRGGRLTYRTHADALPDDEHPDAVARRVAGFDADAPDGSLLHSTSWRFAGGRIVLTYVALPDTGPGGTPVGPASVVCSGDPLAPSPEAVRDTDVAAHACRHLAFLHGTDPAVTAAARHHPALWTLIRAHRPDVAGAIA